MNVCRYKDYFNEHKVPWQFHQNLNMTDMW